MIRNVSPDTGEQIMTIAKQLRTEGKAEGLAEGKAEVARGMLKKGYPVSDIAELTGLSIKEIEKLREQ